MLNWRSPDLLNTLKLPFKATTSWLGPAAPIESGTRKPRASDIWVALKEVPATGIRGRGPGGRAEGVGTAGPAPGPGGRPRRGAFPGAIPRRPPRRDTATIFEKRTF